MISGVAYDRIFERNKLESFVDLPENRSYGNSDRLFSGGVLCQKEHEIKTGSQGSDGWTPAPSAGTPAYSSRIFAASDLQPEKAFRKLSSGEL